MLDKGKIIFLNGTSSSGKSTLAIKLQEISEEIFYHVQLDTFCDMIHEKFFDSHFTGTEDLAATVMHNFILSLSDNCKNVIVDTVIENHHESWLKESVLLLHRMPVTFVKVTCPLEELERRELQRGNRDIGLAKWQTSHMDFNDIYDLKVDTYKNSTEQCVKIILSRLNLNSNENSAFSKLYRQYYSQYEHS